MPFRRSWGTHGTASGSVIGRTLNVVADMADISAYTSEGIATGAEETPKHSGEEYEGVCCL